MRGNQRGSVLIEFSLIAVSLSLLIALVVDVARMVFIAQMLQDAARVAARELSLLPLPPTITFDQALQLPQVKDRIFDPADLVIEIDQFENSDKLREFLDGLPIVNRMLRPLMTFDQMMVEGRVRQVLHFPGIVLHNRNHENQQSWSIGIPRAGLTENMQGHTFRWTSVLEEMRGNPDDPQTGSFSLQTLSASQPSGLVALRVNYPFQPMFMNWLPQSVLPDSTTLSSVDEPYSRLGVLSDVEQQEPETSLNRVGQRRSPSIIKGSPEDFQGVLSGQAVFRREVFQ